MALPQKQWGHNYRAGVPEVEATLHPDRFDNIQRNPKHAGRAYVADAASGLIHEPPPWNLRSHKPLGVPPVDEDVVEDVHGDIKGKGPDT